MVIFKLFLVRHVIVCVVLIVVVLLQSSKGGGLAGAFGGGGGQTMFGGQETATFLSKTTRYLAIMFMVLSLSLAFLSSRQSRSGGNSAVREAAQRRGDVIPRGESVERFLSAATDTSGGSADTTRAEPSA